MQIIFETDKIKIEYDQLGMLGNNVYILSSANEKALFDPSCNPEQILEMVENKLDKILLTHYH